MVCFRYISMNTLHKGDHDDGDKSNVGSIWVILLVIYLCLAINTLLNTQNEAGYGYQIKSPMAETHTPVDFGYIGLGYYGSFFNSPTTSLCFVTVTTSVTPVSHISDLRFHLIS